MKLKVEEISEINLERQTQEKYDIYTKKQKKELLRLRRQVPLEFHSLSRGNKCDEPSTYEQAAIITRYTVTNIKERKNALTKMEAELPCNLGFFYMME